MTQGRRPRVLCVDDDMHLLRSLRWLLSRDHDVVVANSVTKALRVLSHAHFDVIISDQRMPGMTGTDLLQHVRELYPRSSRILLTGYSDFEAVVSSLNDSEVFRFVTKPWDNDELLATVAAAVKHARSKAGRTAKATPLSELAFAMAKEHVLVFDQSREAGQHVEAALRGAMHMEWSDDLDDALEALTSGAVALLVTNITDPGLRQIDLIRAMALHLPTIPIAVYSERRDSAVLGQLINDHHIFRYITRPADASTLRDIIRAGLGLHRERINTASGHTTTGCPLSSSAALEALRGALARPRSDLSEVKASEWVKPADPSWLQRLFKRTPRP